MKNSGSTSVTVSNMINDAPGFSVSNLELPLTLHAGKSVTFSVTFAPLVEGVTNGSLTFQSDPNNLLTLAVHGIGVVPWSLHANPASLDFGKLTVGRTRKLEVALTNSGSSSVTVSQDSIAPVGFVFTDLPETVVIHSGHSFTFHIKFTPQVVGETSGTMQVSNPTSPILRISLSGAGVEGIIVTPTPLAFGNVVAGTSLQQTGTLTAAGASVTINSANIDNALFVLSGLIFPVKLSAGQSLPFAVTFSPLALGSQSGTLSFALKAGNSAKEAFTGIGISPYSVYLSWNASTSKVVGYNVYRRESDTAYARVNSTLVSGTQYTDRAVIAGETYYYKTKAVAKNGQESGPSNRATAAIP